MKVVRSQGLINSEIIRTMLEGYHGEFQHNDYGVYGYKCDVDTFNNCRETGFVFRFTLLRNNTKQVFVTTNFVVWVMENRNSDNIRIHFTNDDYQTNNNIWRNIKGSKADTIPSDFQRFEYHKGTEKHCFEIAPPQLMFDCGEYQEVFDKIMSLVDTHFHKWFDERDLSNN